MSTGVRIVVWIAVALVAVWLLFTVIFPWVDRYLLADPTLSLLGSAARR